MQFSAKKMVVGFHDGVEKRLPVYEWARIHSEQAGREVRTSEIASRIRIGWDPIDAVSRYFNESVGQYKKRVPQAQKQRTKPSAMEAAGILFLERLAPPPLKYVNGERCYS